jgi:tetratricopeptide (TPR) repeat protein
MGEDDRAAGKTAEAAQEFAEAYRVTADLLAREPNNPERLFNHAQSEYWMGSVPFDQGDKARTRPHWAAYLDLAQRMVELQPGKIEWQRELGYAQANMCALAQFKPVEPDKALEHCGLASRVAGDLARAHPEDLAAQIDFASNIAWHADASRLAGKGDAAVSLRQQQVALCKGLAQRHPRDMRALEAMLKAEIGLAMTHSELGQLAQARTAAQRALDVSKRLVAQDPENERWLTLRKRAEGLIADPASKGKIKEGT